MSTGVGIDAVEVEGEWVGRSALDDRLLTRASYHNLGIVMGGVVEPSPSAMSYTVGPGTDPVSVGVGSRSGADGASLFVIPHGTVATTAAPASGARIDVVWALQHDPSKGDADNQSVLGVTQGAASGSPVAPALPVGAVELASYSVPAGATRTSEATRTHTGDYAIPYGASLGLLHQFRDTSNSAVAKTLVNRGAGTFTLPTPRRVDFRLSPTIMSSVPDGSGSMYHRLYINNVLTVSWMMNFINFGQSELFIHSQELPAGEHSVRYATISRAGDTWRGLYGAYQGEVYPGTLFQVVDAGVA